MLTCLAVQRCKWQPLFGPVSQNFATDGLPDINENAHFSMRNARSTAHAGALDAYFACQAAIVLDRDRQHSHTEALRALWQRAPFSKELLKGLTARAWSAPASPGSQGKSALSVKRAALRVQAALAAYNMLEGDRILPFAKGAHIKASKHALIVRVWHCVQTGSIAEGSLRRFDPRCATLAGTAMARALEDKNEHVRAAAASLIPVYVACVTRSHAKIVAAACSTLEGLSGGDRALSSFSCFALNVCGCPFTVKDELIYSSRACCVTSRRCQSIGSQGGRKELWHAHSCTVHCG
jgi:hypothetical protein